MDYTMWYVYIYTDIKRRDEILKRLETFDMLSGAYWSKQGDDNGVQLFDIHVLQGINGVYSDVEGTFKLTNPDEFRKIPTWRKPPTEKDQDYF